MASAASTASSSTAASASAPASATSSSSATGGAGAGAGAGRGAGAAAARAARRSKASSSATTTTAAAAASSKAKKKELRGGDREWLAFVLEYMCDMTADNLRMSVTGATLTKELMEEAPKSSINIYRKQHGNVKAIMRSSKFDELVFDDNNVLKLAHPFPASFDAVSHLVDKDLYDRVAKTVTELQEEKKRRGVKNWERVNC